MVTILLAAADNRHRDEALELDESRKHIHKLQTEFQHTSLQREALLDQELAAASERHRAELDRELAAAEEMRLLSISALKAEHHLELAEAGVGSEYAAAKGAAARTALKDLLRGEMQRAHAALKALQEAAAARARARAIEATLPPKRSLAASKTMMSGSPTRDSTPTPPPLPVPPPAAAAPAPQPASQPSPPPPQPRMPPAAAPAPQPSPPKSPSPKKASPNKKKSVVNRMAERAVNVAESMVGRDLDGDGDIGQEGTAAFTSFAPAPMPSPQPAEPDPLVLARQALRASPERAPAEPEARWEAPPEGAEQENEGAFDVQDAPPPPPQNNWGVDLPR